jgi:hypothetical protein
MSLASIIHLYNTASFKQRESILVAPKTPFIHRTNDLETISKSLQNLFTSWDISCTEYTVKAINEKVTPLLNFLRTPYRSRGEWRYCSVILNFGFR